MAELLAQTTIGFCAWDIPTLIILIVVIATFAVQHHKMKKEEEDLRKQGF